MTRRKRPAAQLDVRAIFESPIGRIGESGNRICAYEAGIRRSVEDAIKGNMNRAGFAGGSNS